MEREPESQKRELASHHDAERCQTNAGKIRLCRERPIDLNLCVKRRTGLPGDNFRSARIPIMAALSVHKLRSASLKCIPDSAHAAVNRSRNARLQVTRPEAVMRLAPCFFPASMVFATKHIDDRCLHAGAHVAEPLAIIKQFRMFLEKMSTEVFKPEKLKSSIRFMNTSAEGIHMLLDFPPPRDGRFPGRRDKATPSTLRSCRSTHRRHRPPSLPKLVIHFPFHVHKHGMSPLTISEIFGRSSWNIERASVPEIQGEYKWAS